VRKLMLFSIGFCAACALSIYVIPLRLLLFTGLFFLAVGGVLLCAKYKKWLRIAAVVFLGLSVGQLWFCGYDAVYLTPIRKADGQTIKITLEAEDFSFETDYGITVDGTIRLAGKRCHVRMYLNQKQPLSPGDVVTGEFRLRYTAPGGKEAATHHSGSGVLLLAYPKGEHTVTAAEGLSYRFLPAYLRQYLLNLMGELFPKDAVAFCKALLLGDTSELGYETESDLSVSGIRHIAAVSGLHVSILFSIVYLFSGKRRGLTVMIGIPVLLVFAAMAGFSPSIVRATLMQALTLFALLFRREYDPPTALAFAVLVMLMGNPMTITSAGFQLSVASVAGIFLFSGRISRWLLDEKRMGRWKKKKLLGKLANHTATSAAVSLSAMLTTIPLTAWYFGMVSLLSIITNLLCLWVVTILFCGIVAACVLAVIWLPLGQLVAWALAWLVRYILLIAGTVAKMPLAAVYTESIYIVVWLVFCYVLLGVFLLSRQKRPVVLCCCAVIALCVALLASWTEPLLDDYRATVLDVGQGQCVLLQSQGRTYMVDCGGEYGEDAADLAASFLLSQGIQRLDGLILTHYDKDHVGGAEYLLHRIDADMVMLPEGNIAQIWDTKILKNHDGKTLRATEEMVIQWGTGKLTVYASWTTETSNESSLCVLFQTEKCDILITGDRSTVGEEVLLHTADIPKLDALVVGHHGAASSTGEALLDALKPETALISVGEGNAYGHPSQTVLERLQQYGCKVRRTDLEGTIIFRG